MIKLQTEMLELVPLMFTLKTEDWKAECEWRLLQSGVIREYGSYKNMPKRSSIVSHDFLKLEAIEGLEPILEITLGSKHSTPKPGLLGFLKRNNFNDVKINESTSSYR